MIISQTMISIISDRNKLKKLKVNNIILSQFEFKHFNPRLCTQIFVMKKKEH